ncbi:MAG: parvulin peptidyl-prolyl isomerase, partial [Desulfobacula sp.]|nr:parvulin peptidyl-prolyl isomerase [Desulfobacula sp.]
SYIKNIDSSGYSGEKRKEAVKQINNKILMAMVDRSLTQQEAQKYQISVSDTEIDNALENVKNARSLSQKEFLNALTNQGVTLKEYRESIEKQILQSKLINHAVKSKVIITESEIKNYYDTNAQKYSGKKKYRLRNILMNNEDRIKEIKKKLDAKIDFPALAKQYSLSPNASDGGDLGLFDISNFSENIKEIISGLNTGEYSNAISTSQGFQIFYVEDIVLDGNKSYEQARDEIHEILYNEQVEKKFKTWLESLKKNAHIKIML